LDPMRNIAGDRLGRGKAADGAVAPCLHQGQPASGCSGHIPGCVAGTLHQWGGRSVPMAEKHPRHRRRVVGAEFPAASGRPPQDGVDRARVLGDPRDNGHIKTLQDLGHIPHQGCQPSSLDDEVHLGIPKKHAKLNELHQLIAIILGTEPLSHPVFRPKLNAFLYVCQDQVSHIK
jgi:hypothetical protein